MKCQACGELGQIGNADLRAVLCWSCDAAFIAWYLARPWCMASDWPGMNRGRLGALAGAAQRARDAIRTAEANAANHAPLRADAVPLLAAWRQHRATAGGAA